MIRSMLRAPVLAAATALFAATPALLAQDASAVQDGRPTVAVMHFNNGATGRDNADLEPLRGGIADILISELSANAAIRVIEREQLDALVREQNLSSEKRVSAETAVRVGKLLGVHHMIFGGFVTVGKDRMRLDARAVNVETGEIEHVESVRGTKDDFATMIESLAAKLNRGMKLPPMPRRTAEATAAPKPPFQVVMLYSRAIAEENAGRRDEAERLYRAALAKFPDYEPARKAADRLAKKGE